MTKIKICGLQTIWDVDVVNRYSPDYVGFVFANSRHKVSMDRARNLKEALDSNIKAVGVFVNEPLLNIIRLCHEGIIDLVQLHGNEDEDYMLKLRMATDNKVIKAIHVQSKKQVAKQMLLTSDYIILDTYVKGSYGGTGLTFDLDLLPDINREFFLAGGLNQDNVLGFIKRIKPYGVDISSGVETNGRKDEKKVREFISKVRSYKQA